jgi:hypothetical protein
VQRVRLMHPANDNNRQFWNGAFAWRRHWPMVLAGLMVGIAVSAGCGMVMRGYWPGLH